MKNLYKIQDELYIIDNNEKVTQNGIWAKCSFTGDILKNRNGQYAHKVILTTNKLLIKDGVQAIDDEFLKWFVKNSSCNYIKTEPIYYAPGYNLDISKEETKQEYEYIGECKGNDNNGCFMDSPGHNCGCFLRKLKQETLEEVAEKEIPNRIRSTAFGSKFEWEPTKERKAFIRGAKWQAERMYSKEDMYKLMDEYQDYLVNTDEICKTFKEWYIKNKKKLI